MFYVLCNFLIFLFLDRTLLTMKEFFNIHWKRPKPQCSYIDFDISFFIIPPPASPAAEEEAGVCGEGGADAAGSGSAAGRL